MDAAPLPALILVDLQEGMRSPALPPRNNPLAEEQAGHLLAAWRRAGAPLVHVRHISRTPGSPFWPGQPGVQFQPAFVPAASEQVFEKNVPDAFIHSGLERWLRVRGLGRLVLVGVATHSSIEATARTGGNLGFAVTVVADATFTFDKPDYRGVPRSADEVHAMSLANLDGEYAQVRSTAQVLALVAGRS